MRKLIALLVLSTAACGGSASSPPEGPLKLGIVSGDNQVAAAGSAKLTDPVVGRLVRVSTASGPRFEFVKTAYAQTVVTGSPVPGAVVCAVSVTPGSMVPFVPCTNTDTNGQATFFFTPGTKAGAAEAEIRGTLAGQPAVFDTAKATVTPGPPVYSAAVCEINTNLHPGICALRKVGETMVVTPAPNATRDKYDNIIDPATLSPIIQVTPLADNPPASSTGGTPGWVATFPAPGIQRVSIWFGAFRWEILVEVS